MGFFGLFENDENKRYKKIYNSVNSNPNYLPYFEALILFAEGSLMMPRMIHNDLLSNEYKKQVSFAYFGGAADMVTQNLNLNDSEAYAFISVYILITFYDGNYKELEQVMNSFVSLTQDKKILDIMNQGAMDFSEMISENNNNNATTFFMRFGKLLDKN